MLSGKKIFITTGGGVGDLIMLTPSLYKLKNLYPSCKLSILTKQQTVEVINRIPWIDYVIGVKRGTFMSRFRVLPELSQQDIVICTDWQPHLLPWMVLFRIPLRAGYARKGKLLNNCLNRKLKNSVFTSEKYAAVTNAGIISEALGIKLEGDMTYCEVSQPNIGEIESVKSKLEVLGIFADTPFVLLAPYTSRYERDWNKKDIVALTQQIEQKYGIPVVIAGQTKEYNDKLVECPNNLLNQTSFFELVWLVKEAKYLICSDSGPMHIAAATRTPVIPLFNKDLPSRWAPKRDCYPIDLRVERCNDFFDIHDYKLKYPNNITDIRNITAEMVFDVFSRVEQVKQYLN